jgi:putative inorganic carbon (hco3(-)) transporter
MKLQVPLTDGVPAVARISAAPWKGLWRDPALMLGAVFIVLAPVYVPDALGRYDGTRFLQLLLLGIVALAVVSARSLRYATLGVALSSEVRIKVGVLGAFLIGLVSTLFAAYPLMALVETAQYVLLLILTLSVAACSLRNRAQVDGVLVTAFLGSALLFLVSFAIAQSAYLSTGAVFPWVSPFMNIGNVRHFSQYQAYTLPLLVLPLLVFDLPKRWRAAVFVIASMWWALQFCTGTRAVWLGMAASVMVILVLPRETGRGWLKCQAATVVVGGLMYLALRPVLKPPGLEDIARRGLDGSSRGELWLRSIELIRESPLLGIGPMHFSYQNFNIAAHPHNVLLQFGAEWGVPATLVLVAVVLWLMWRAIVITRQTQGGAGGHINVALLASIIAGFSDAMLSGNNIMPLSQTTLFIVAGWYAGRMLAQAETGDQRKNHSSPWWQHATFVVLVAAALAIVGCSAWHYLSHRAMRDESHIDYYHPRYWINGHWPAR